jgi:hypothetical protein
MQDGIAPHIANVVLHIGRPLEMMQCQDRKLVTGTVRFLQAEPLSKVSS